MSNPLPKPAPPSRFFTEEELQTYHRDGVVCARGLLDAATIDHLREALEDVLEKLSVLGKDALNRESQGFHGDIFIWKLHDVFRDLALFSSLPTLAHQVLGTETINFFYEQFFVKRAGCPVDTPWHQDIKFRAASGAFPAFSPGKSPSLDLLIQAAMRVMISKSW